MEKQMETTGVIGLYRDNGKENGNYYIVYWVYTSSNIDPGVVLQRCITVMYKLQFGITVKLSKANTKP